MVPFFITRNFIPEMYNKNATVRFLLAWSACPAVYSGNYNQYLHVSSNIDKDSEVTDSKISIPVARLCLLRNLVILPHDLDTPTWMILKLLIFFVPIFFSFITNTCSRGESYVINIPYSSLKCKSEDWTWYRTECSGILSTRNRCMIWLRT